LKKEETMNTTTITTLRNISLIILGALLVVLANVVFPNGRAQQQEMTLQRLADEFQLRQIADEIDFFVDAKDWDRVRTYFTNDITVDFSSLVGGEPANITADQLVDSWRTNLIAEKQSHHMRTNHIVTFDGEDNATLISQGYAYNAIPGIEPVGSDIWEVYGNYVHTFERTEAGWLVTGMTFNAKYQMGNDLARTYLPEATN
jgi:hypothetical protein